MGRGHTDTHVHRHTCPQTYGHRDSMIESAQWADSMKIRYPPTLMIGVVCIGYYQLVLVDARHT